MFYQLLLIYLPDVKMNTCTICAKSFSRSDNLKRHRRLKHENSQTGNGYEGEQDLPALRQAVVNGEKTSIFDDDSSNSSNSNDTSDDTSDESIESDDLDVFIDSIQKPGDDDIDTFDDKVE